MRLSMQDKHEILKAAAKGWDADSLKRWLVEVVEATDDLPDGKYDAAVPPYRPPAVAGAFSGWAPATPILPVPGDGMGKDFYYPPVVE